MQPQNPTENLKTGIFLCVATPVCCKWPNSFSDCVGVSLFRPGTTWSEITRILGFFLWFILLIFERISHRLVLLYNNHEASRVYFSDYAARLTTNEGFFEKGNKGGKNTVQQTVRLRKHTFPVAMTTTIRKSNSGVGPQQLAQPVTESHYSSLTSSYTTCTGM